MRRRRTSNDAWSPPLCRSAAAHAIPTGRDRSKRRLPRAALVGLAAPAHPDLRPGVAAPTLGDAGERAPHPAGHLPLAELVGHPERGAQVLLGLVEPTQRSLGDAALRRGVGELPPRPEVFKHRDRALEPLERLLVATHVLEDAGPLDGGHRDAELVTDLLGERVRLLGEVERPSEVGTLAVEVPGS